MKDKLFPRLDASDVEITEQVKSMTDDEAAKLHGNLLVVLNEICNSVLPAAIKWQTCKFKFGFHENKTPRGTITSCFSMYMTDTDYPDSAPATILDVDTIEVTIKDRITTNDRQHEFKTVVKAQDYVMLAVLKHLFMTCKGFYVTKQIPVKTTGSTFFESSMKHEDTSICKVEKDAYASVQANVDLAECSTIEELMLKLAISTYT